MRPVPTTLEQIERVKFEINRRKRTRAALKDQRVALKDFKALLMRDLKNAKNAAIDRARDEKKRVSTSPHKRTRARATTPFPCESLTPSYPLCVPLDRQYPGARKTLQQILETKVSAWGTSFSPGLALWAAGEEEPLAA